MCQAMVDILLDELHSHLYLKSFYCESRWRSYTRGQTERASSSAATKLTA